MGLFREIDLIKPLSAIQAVGNPHRAPQSFETRPNMRSTPVTTPQFDAHHHWLVASKVDLRRNVCLPC